MSGHIEIGFPARELCASGKLRLDVFLSRRLHGYSRAAVQRMIAEGRVLLRGARARPAARVDRGDTVVVRYPRRPDPPPRYDRLPVIHEDGAVLAVNKPGGMLSHPTDKVLRNAVTTILAGQFPGRRLHLVHRLDRETSGVLVLAKDPVTARALQERFAGRVVRKEYLALVRGRVRFRRRVVDRPLAREGGEIKVRQTVADETGARSAGSSPEDPRTRPPQDVHCGRSAVTVFERVAAGLGCSLVRARPLTGRLHQIRVHLAWLGHPVLGDKLYTGEGGYYLKAVSGELTRRDLRELGAARQMLHARRVLLGGRLDLEAPLPDDFREALERGGLDGDLTGY